MEKTLLLLVFFLGSQIVCSQMTGQFPVPKSIALNKPIFATSTCGTNGAENFCGFSTDIAASLAPNCLNSTCNDTCHYSDRSPSPIDLTTFGDLGEGVTIEFGGPSVSNSSVLRFSNSYVNISSISLISANGFSFAAWIKQESGNTGTLISKSNSDGSDIVYAVSITEASLTFHYRPNSIVTDYTSLVISGIYLSSNFWHHVAVTVYENDFALYINGSIENATGLIGAISDSQLDVYLGQTAPSVNYYNGLMQEVYYYSQALTEREVQELIGQLPFIHLSSKCHCPPSHPVISTINPDRCIQHTGVTTGRGSVMRINADSHTAGYANDNIHVTSWVSSINQKEVNLTMSLIVDSASAYELIFVFIYYGAPAPKAAILEKSIDGGQTFQPLQYFADDCNYYFGLADNALLTASDEVNCITQYSNQIPLTNEVARVRFLDPSVRPGDYNTDPDLRQFILADHIQITMLDFFSDNTTTDQHRYYDILEIIIAARCACNGHAARCSDDAICECTHNTKGDRCDECLDLFNDKPWKEGTTGFANPCKICNCNNHASSCIYNGTLDPFPDSRDLGGGGVCSNCQDNTDGRYCETCMNGFYRPAGANPSDTNPCVPCDCNTDGSVGTDCVKHEGIPGKVAGNCNCRENVQGRACDQCKPGFYNLNSVNVNGCEPCNCNINGTVGGSENCNSVTGQCSCKVNVEGLKCDVCTNGTKGLSAVNLNGCSQCDCNITGSIDTNCDVETGQCSCKTGVYGVNCDACRPEYHSMSSTGCQPCSCSPTGSINNICNPTNGVCQCHAGFTGDLCNQCADNYFDFEAGCLPCNCSSIGTLEGATQNCDNITGQCLCKSNVQGRACDSCMENFTNFQSGCSPCDCILTNTNTSGSLCNPITSQCSCLPFATGLNCQLCNDGFYLHDSNSACSPCLCSSEGAINTSCDSVSGQCYCKNDVIDGRACDTCLNGHYGFPECLSCSCNTSGSIDTVCNVTTGKCHCKQFVTGMNCDICAPGFQLLQATNPFGCTKAPTGQNAPIIISQTSESIEISWTEPDEPNGVIQHYRLYRNNTMLTMVPESINTYNDTGLTANTVFVYQVESVNIIGADISSPLVAMTAESAPEQVNPPTFIVINSTSVQAFWQSPNISNGILTEYRLTLVAVNNITFDEPQTKFTGNAMSAIIGDLSAFTINYFVLQACTSVGCSSSDLVSITTLEASPEFQPAPTIIALNSSSVQIMWEAPKQPNGEIVMYQVDQRLVNDSENSTTVNTVPANIFQLIVSGLEPYTFYEYRIISFTNGGGTSSIWVQIRTLEAAPEDVNDPNVIVVSSNELQVNWTMPTTPNGVITEYRIYYQNLETNLTVSVANYSQPGSYIVSGLTPFTGYGFYMAVCNMAGCTLSSIVTAITLETAPIGVNPPNAITTNNNMVELTWAAPSQPNGIIKTYNITRVSSDLLSPLDRDLGTPFYGTSYASFPPENSSSGVSIAISLYFKTLQPNGTLVYWINSAKTDIFAIELRNGTPWYVFDSGSGPAILALDTNISFSDGEWHHLRSIKNGKSGTITIDKVYTVSGTSVGSSQFLGAPEVFYIGGLAKDAPLSTMSSSQSLLEGYTFAGCLFGIKIDDVYLDFNHQLNPNSGIGMPAFGCPINLESGISFIGGGYLTTEAFESPGTEGFRISVTIKTKATSGLILFADGSTSHLIISIVNSNLRLQIKGTDTNELVLSSNNIICDGEWHTLDFIKEEDGIVVQIDDTITSTMPLSDGLTLNTYSVSYFGGLPVNSATFTKYQDITSEYPYEFTGCIRNFQLDDALIDLKTHYINQANVRMYGCEDNNGIFTCADERNTFTANNALSFTDTTVTPFSEYTYQVVAETSAGANYSSWITIVTHESAPIGVGLASLINMSSTTFTLTWQRPSEPNGLITHYDITAIPISTYGLSTPLGNSMTVTKNIILPNEHLVQSISGLNPATNYSVALVAFTSTSSSSMNESVVYFNTLEDVPIGVQPPLTISQTSSSLTFMILPPTQPNGVIVSYRLYINGVVLTLNSSQQTTNVFNLSPFTSYEFHIEACTTTGCANSSINSSMTLSAMPAVLNPPTFNPLSPTSISISWNTPVNPNGVILYYSLVQLTVNGEVIIFNGTNLQYIVTNLSPNTNYSFKVIAYNSVGSVSSNISTVLTPEGVPDQLFPPNITTINSSSLLVTWQAPLSPNGQIINYTLIQNNSVVFLGLTFNTIVINLQPFTTYAYAVQACTIKGCSTSVQSTAQTSEAAPQGYVAPLIGTITSQSISLTIQEVTEPNGIVTYTLTVTGEFLLSVIPSGRNTTKETRTVFSSSTVGDVTTGNLLPFTNYSYQLEVSNSAGNLFGETFHVSTLSAVPEHQTSPILSLLSATSVLVAWTPPMYTNGFITSYTLTVNPAVSNANLVYPSNVSTAVLDMLAPFTMYSVSITASNNIGSVSSDASNITTGETAPSGFDQITVLSRTAYSSFITWDPPLQPNGIILNYTIVADDNVVETVEVGILMYNVTGLQPYSTYNISVIACNSAGCIDSPPAIVTTNEAVPDGIEKPAVEISTSGYVVVTWSEPNQPNGLITSYTVYKSLTNEPASILANVSSSSELRYNDSDIEPFTSYEYHIEATNNAGSGTSDSTSITTPEAAPMNVLEPVLEAISSSSVRVTIIPPITPNGIITEYRITRNTMFLISLPVTNPSHDNITHLDVNLIPYTNYSYAVVACTDGGCSTLGPSAFIITLQAPPENIQPPINTLTDNGESLTITWQDPLTPNGVITNYTLIRANLGYYNISSVTNCCEKYLNEQNDFSDSCSLVNHTSFDVTSYVESDDLDYYSFYQYCVIATNIAGSVGSTHSNTQRTAAAPIPIAGPSIAGFPLNSTAIQIYWTEPNVEALLGPLESYTIYFNGSDGFSGNEVIFNENYTLTGLTPDTAYTFTVYVSNTRGSSQGNVITVKTLDGIPAGVLAPTVSPLSSTSLLITFVIPLMPNGADLTYIIILDSVILHNQTTEGNYIATGLNPFTIYSAQLEVCTTYGCTASSLSSNRTLEAAPTGFASPSVQILSPYAVFVSWTPPSQPNGIISEYQLYLRESCSQELSDNQPCYNFTLISSGSKIFNYTVLNLSPYTTYGFGIIVINGGGNTSSGFTTITTNQASPTTVQPPVLTPLSSSAILVKWQVPDEPNGVVNAYNLFMNGTSVFGPTLLLTYTNSSLSPYTFYSFVVQACTLGGCTNSSAAVTATLEAPPSDFDNPVISDVGSVSLTISWTAPANPNGRNIYYVTYFDNNTFITNTTFGSAFIAGLSPFTNYSFYVTACNIAGCTVSDVVSKVTNESAPVGVAITSFTALSFERIEITWSPPTQPNGIILYYRLFRNGVVVFQNSTLQFVDTNLEGGKLYSYQVEAVNSAGGTLSPSISVTTPTGSPTGINPPLTYVINSTAIYVEWNEPQKANGDISSYQVYLDNVLVYEDLVFNYTLTNLSAYTVYTIRIQVCTVQGDCGSSVSVMNTTEPDNPSGVSPPTVTTVTATTAVMSWLVPSMPNGIISSYRIMRRLLNNPLAVIFVYAGSPSDFTFTDQGLSPFTQYEYQLVVVNTAGSTPSTWTAVTTLEDIPTGVPMPTSLSIFPTNVTLSWQAPLNPNGVINQYDVFYRLLLGNLMVAVTVPGNTTGATVTGLQPYTTYEFKIRATNNAGSGDSDFEVVTTSESAPEMIGFLNLITKTSDSLTLRWSSPSIPNGIITNYVIYLNGVEEFTGTDTMYTVSRLEPYTGYFLQLEACTSAGCTRGNIQSFTTTESDPIGQPPPVLSMQRSRSVLIQWDPPLQPNGIITSYEVYRMQVPELLLINGTEGAVLVYSTNDVATRSYNDTSLSPYTGYQYAIKANNSIGSSTSAFAYIQTLEDVPESIPQPFVEILNAYEIRVSWNDPLLPNGVITSYEVFRTGPDNVTSSEYTGLNKFFVDTGLKPYTQYSYFVQACTQAGCANGISSVNITNEAIPESFSISDVIAHSYSVIGITWQAPSMPNGVITTYIVEIISPVNISIPTQQFSLNITSLQAFTTYTVIVKACTIIGCVSSESTLIQTLESIPMGITAPSVSVIGPTSTDCQWTTPAQPNGVIIRYILRRNDTIAYDGLNTTFVDINLLPNHPYVYNVQAFTSVGGSEQSPSTFIITDSDTPTDINPPNLTALTSTSVLASWNPPGNPNGVIQEYKLYRKIGNVETLEYTGTGLGYFVDELLIFTTYSFRIEACTTTCGSSLYNQVTTLEALPNGQSPPSLQPFFNETVLVTWLPPSTPNGIITSYSLQRRQVLGGGFFGSVTDLSTNIFPETLQYLDDDEDLAPALTYQYRVSVANSVGGDTSEYSTVTLLDGIPSGVPLPELINKTSTSVALSVSPPAVPNGLITEYHLYGTTLSPQQALPLSQSDPVTFEFLNLNSFTEYKFYAASCTSAGCGVSLNITVRTNPDIPTDLLPLTPTVTGPRSIMLNWNPPAHPNGIISSYYIWFKTPCPQPTTQPNEPECVESEYQLLDSTSLLSFEFTSSGTSHPYPYRSYQFLLGAENSVGRTNSTVSDTVTTQQSAPEVSGPVLFTIFQSNQSVFLNWTNSFHLNGVLSHYIVIRDGAFLLQGTQTFAVFGNQPIETELTFSVKAVTAIGEVTTPPSPLYILGLTVQPSITTSPTVGTEEPTIPNTPFYEQPPFIIGIVVVVLLICFVLFLVFLCLLRPRSKEKKYDVMSLKSQGSPVRDDGTVRASWGLVDSRMTPVPSYHEAMQQNAISNARAKSYSPSKVALLSQDFTSGDIPLQDTHITRLSKIDIPPEAILDSAIDALNPEPTPDPTPAQSAPPTTITPNSTPSHSQRSSPLKISETTFTDTKI